MIYMDPFSNFALFFSTQRESMSVIGQVAV